ncbi:Peptidase propeptide and YPEB domain protein [Neomoorella glycerini]|uniref:Peptidase propeptide and YPEB domain protein n=1 Tax=Neomoorella glycerini TaxID=55779 RepID=A0A6I5ZXI0_9FIRM|nr:Peptidase propeptide and YPEB domain protein [Moorella glycerini]
MLGAVAGMGVFYNQPAKAAITPLPAVVQSASPVSTAPATGHQQTPDNQQPAYNASIKVANPQNDTDTEVNDANEKQGEAAESQALQAKAKITADAAKDAALKAVPGTVKKVSLDNENGNLVYSVEVQTAGGIVDVKVDAGNGQVLARDNGRDGEKGRLEEGRHSVDNDNIQQEE